jgi:two-component system, chemotaxis family, CheB/CheR fusion protein
MAKPKKRNSSRRKGRSDSSEEANVNDTETTASSMPFPIVGIGASAGGIEAFSQVLRALPVDTGMAFVLIQHLDPSHPSMLADILSRVTKMPVMTVHDRTRVDPDHVYVIPPDADLSLTDGHLMLVQRKEGRGQHHPVDSFLRSLAQERGHHAIGVILSGGATDGTLGVAESRHRAASRLPRTIPRSSRACRGAPLPPAAWISC